MFWLGFLFADENRQLKELEQRKKDRQAEQDRETIGFMVKKLTPQLEFMKKTELDNLTFPILDLSKFDYSLLSKALTKCGSKIAYTRLEKEDGTFTLTLYKNRPEAISRLYLAILLRGLLWLVLALLVTTLVFGVLSPGLELVKSQFTSSFLVPILLNFLVVFFIIISSNAIASVLFRNSKVAKEFEHTVRFDKVVEND
jgi:hypothetical protein